MKKDKEEKSSTFSAIRTFFHSNFFPRPKKDLGPKKLKVHKNFWTQKSLCPNNLFVQINNGSGKIFGLKIYGSKTIFDGNKLGQISFG